MFAVDTVGRRGEERAEGRATEDVGRGGGREEVGRVGLGWISLGRWVRVGTSLLDRTAERHPRQLRPRPEPGSTHAELLDLDRASEALDMLLEVRDESLERQSASYGAYFLSYLPWRRLRRRHAVHVVALADGDSNAGRGMQNRACSTAKSYSQTPGIG